MAGLEKFVEDPQGIGEMLRSSETDQLLTGRAERVLTAAQAGASNHPEFAYHLEHVVTDRAVVRVGSDNPHAWYYEAYTGNLLRALDAAGGSA